MTYPCGVDHQVMEVIIQSPGRALDEIVFDCPDLTWNQVFLLIDRLTREGILSLIPKGHGRYAVYLSKPVAES
jgi:hypothetical protein